MSENGYLDLYGNNRAFRRLWLAQVISLTGDRASAVALLALVLQLTGSGFFAALVLGSNMLAPLLVFPISSVVVDQRSRKRLIVGSRLIGAVMALAMLLVGSRETIWIGFLAVFGMSAMNAFAAPASQAALPNLVAKEQLGRANAAFGSAQGISLGIGPLIGGLVFAEVGPDLVFILNAFSFVVSAGLTYAIRRPFSEGSPGGQGFSPLRQITLGISYMRSERRLSALLTIKLVFALAGGGAFVLLPIFAVRVFDSGEVGIGVLFAARGAGALLGPFVGRALVRENERRLFFTIGVLTAVFAAAYVGFTMVDTIAVAVPLVILAHTGGFAMWTMTSYGFQRVATDQFRGRILAVDFSLSTSMMAVAMLATGKWAETTSVRVVLTVEASVLAIAALAWTLATRDLWSTDRRNEAKSSDIVAGDPEAAR